MHIVHWNYLFHFKHGDSVKKKKKNPDEILKDYSEAVVGN